MQGQPVAHADDSLLLGSKLRLSWPVDSDDQMESDLLDFHQIGISQI